MVAGDQLNLVIICCIIVQIFIYSYIQNYLITNAQPGHWQYHDSVLTDQDPVDIAKLCVREKLLDHLPKEIPYGITIVSIPRALHPVCRYTLRYYN